MKTLALFLNKNTNTLLLTLVLSFFLTPDASATIKTTVADGDWYTPSNWSPAGYPAMEDTVIINHTIECGLNEVQLVASWLIVNAGKSILSDTTFVLQGNLLLKGTIDVGIYVDGLGDSTIVEGLLRADDLTFSNAVTMNHGVIEAGAFSSGQSLSNYGTIESLNLLTGGPQFTNHTGGAIRCDSCIFSSVTLNSLGAFISADMELFMYENFTNNGDITCVNWTNLLGTTDGSGRFCVDSCFKNFSDIEGTLDICDATPGVSACDEDLGTIASTVTTCTAGPCSGLSFPDGHSAQLVTVFPNPTSGSCTLLNVAEGAYCVVTDMNGKLLLSATATETILQFDLSEFDSGIYIVSVFEQNQFITTRVIKN